MFDKSTDDIGSVNEGAGSLEVGYNFKVSAPTILITIVPGKHVHTGACDEQLFCVIKLAAFGVTTAVAVGGWHIITMLVMQVIIIH